MKDNPNSHTLMVDPYDVNSTVGAVDESDGGHDTRPTALQYLLVVITRHPSQSPVKKYIYVCF